LELQSKSNTSSQAPPVQPANTQKPNPTPQITPGVQEKRFDANSKSNTFSNYFRFFVYF
jgi:hypothetical protein